MGAWRKEGRTTRGVRVGERKEVIEGEAGGERSESDAERERLMKHKQ
jgi:hypothetical protein